MKLDQPYHLKCQEALAPVISEITGDDEDGGYHRGPVKGLPRMNEKLAEYVQEHKDALAAGAGDAGKQFPRAACLIDPLRNSIAFSSAEQIVKAFAILEGHDELKLVTVFWIRFSPDVTIFWTAKKQKTTCKSTNFQISFSNFYCRFFCC